MEVIVSNNEIQCTNEMIFRLKSIKYTQIQKTILVQIVCFLSQFQDRFLSKWLMKYLYRIIFK